MKPMMLLNVYKFCKNHYYNGCSRDEVNKKGLKKKLTLLPPILSSRMELVNFVYKNLTA